MLCVMTLVPPLPPRPNLLCCMHMLVRLTACLLKTPPLPTPSPSTPPTPPPLVKSTLSHADAVLQNRSVFPSRMARAEGFGHSTAGRQGNPGHCNVPVTGQIPSRFWAGRNAVGGKNTEQTRVDFILLQATMKLGTDVSNKSFGKYATDAVVPPLTCP